MASIDDGFRAIERLSRLPKGWDYGSGGPSTATACVQARNLLTLLRTLGLREFDVVPGKEGAITVAACKDGYELEIQCLGTGRFDLYATARDDMVLDDEDLLFGRLAELLGSLNWLAKRSSILFIPNVIYGQLGGSRASLSRTPPTDQASPSSAQNVLIDQDGLSVSTLNDITEQRYAANRRSFGVSKSPLYQTA